MKSPLLVLCIIVVCAVSLAVSLSACNLPEKPQTIIPDAEFTQAVLTIVAKLTQTAFAPTQPLSPTTVEASATPLPPTLTPVMTVTPLPTATSSPTLTPVLTDCINKIKFISDVTIPDDTVVYPGETFDKTWRLQNDGTCTWTKEYVLVFDSGDPMGGPTSQPLTVDVPPGQAVEVTVTLKSPGTPGTYTANWKLRSPQGQTFGLGKNADVPFYVRIEVAEHSDELNLGAPTWRDPLDGAGNWYLPDTEALRFTIENGHLIMLARQTGGTDSWALAYPPAMKDYYLEATFKNGDACSGLDRYGVLARSPDPNAGYVFGFSCDGRYRLYAWDGQTYHGIQEWRDSIHIKSGPGAENRLGIWMKGETIRLYANGIRLAEFSDDTFDEGKFGLFINATNTSDYTVYVEEVAYWSLDQ